MYISTINGQIFFSQPRPTRFSFHTLSVYALWTLPYNKNATVLQKNKIKNFSSLKFGF
jgi:hypothetical protein